MNEPTSNIQDVNVSIVSIYVNLIESRDDDSWTLTRATHEMLKIEPSIHIVQRQPPTNLIIILCYTYAIIYMFHLSM